MATNVGLTPGEQSFFDASIEEQRKRQQEETERQAQEAKLERRSRNFLRALAGVLIVATIIAVGLSIFAFNQQDIAQDNEATATYAQGQALMLAHAEATSAAEALEQKNIAEDEAKARSTQQAIAEAEVIARSTAQAEAEIAKVEAQQQASVGLANAALLELESGIQDRAVNLALEALENYPYTSQAEQALSQAVMQSRLRGVFYHERNTKSVQWSPDGRRLLTASADGTAKIWEPSSGKELLSLDHDDRVIIALWSDDGTQVLTVESGSWNIILWDSYSGEKIVVMEGHTKLVTCADWSQDGSRVLSGSVDMTARVWDAKTGELLRSLEHPGAVQKTRWSPSGETFVTMGEDAPVIWDASTGEQIITLKGHTEYIWDGRWSPKGDRLLTTAEDNSVKVWDTRNGELLLDIPVIYEGGMKSRWSPDGNKILVMDPENPGPSIYDAITGKKLLELDPDNSNAFQRVAVWSPSGDRVATGFWDGSVVVWDSSDGNILFMLRRHSSRVFSDALEDNLHWSPDGRWLASGSRDGSVMVWDTLSDFTISHLPGLSHARWSPTGDRILRVYRNGATIYDSANGNLLLTVENDMKMAFGNYWSPLGDKFGLAPFTGELRIHDASSGAEVLRIVLPGNAEFLEEYGVSTVTLFGWSPDGQRIAAGHDFGGTVRIWNALSGEELLVLRDEVENFALTPNIYFSEVRWSPLGDKILTADLLTHLIVWDADTGEKLLHFRDFENDEVWRAAWSPDGIRIATHTKNNIGNIWDAVTGEKLLEFSGHTGEVHALFWSPTGERLATGGYDNTVRVWDTSTGDQVLHYPFDRRVDHVDWSPDGATLLISNFDRLLVLPVWNSTQELIDHAKECCVVRELTPNEREVFGLSSTE
jgi:WD40 repeat protein